MEVFKNDPPSFGQFLEKFCQEHSGAVGQGECFPHRLVNYYLLETEYEAECADWTLQYLNANKCPSLLASYTAHAVAKEALTWDRTAYLERVVQNSEEPLKESSEDKNSSDTDILEENEEAADEDEKPPQYEVARLAPAVFSYIHQLCDNWRRQPPDLQCPKTAPDISVWAIRNARRKMEDRHVVLPYLNTLCDLQDKPEQAFYAVFDGHGGVDAAVYASAHLHRHLVRHPAFDSDPLTAMKDAFIKTDEDFVTKSEREGLKSGTTGVCALVRDTHVHISWLGDSQVLLVKNGEPVEVMKPHKPEREDERKRIEELGGCVVWFGVWRVNGSLSVSRAIGDADYKPYISSLPDVCSLPLDGTEDYVVLGCDGLWDTVTPNQIVTDVYQYLQDNANDRAGLAQHLTMIARERGSADNITVIVVFFREDIGTPKPRPKSPEKIEDAGQDSAAKEADGDGADNNNEKKDSAEKDSPDDSDKSSSSPNSGNKEEDGDAVSGDRVRKENRSPKSQSPDSKTNSMDVSSSSYSPQVERPKSDIVLTQHNLLLSDVQSDTSSTDINLLQTAAKCVNNRRAKRSKNGRRRSLNNGRRASKDKMLTGLAHRTNSSTPTKGSGNGKSDAKVRTESIKESYRGIARTGENVLHMLTGCTPSMMRAVRDSGKWTVAREIESASAMFNE